MKVLIVAAGQRPSKDLFLKYYNMCDKKIAVDKGAEVFLDYGLSFDYLVGDLDSLSCNYKSKIKNIEKFIYPSEKDYVDSEVAIKLVRDIKAQEIIMLGMTGNRLDHTLGNIGLLNRCLKDKIKSYIIDDFSIISLEDKPFILKGRRGQIISFYAFSNVVEGLTIKNAKYELEDYDLDGFESLCNSNEFLDEDIEVFFKTGKLLVIYSKE
ncbi:MAG: thiamine diphosphokinase [Sarcina sp.]